MAFSMSEARELSHSSGVLSRQTMNFSKAFKASASSGLKVSTVTRRCLFRGWENASASEGEGGDAFLELGGPAFEETERGGGLGELVEGGGSWDGWKVVSGEFQLGFDLSDGGSEFGLEGLDVFGLVEGLVHELDFEHGGSGGGFLFDDGVGALSDAGDFHEEGHDFGGDVLDVLLFGAAVQFEKVEKAGAGVAEDVVGLVDRLEFLFGASFVGRFVGMMGGGELEETLLQQVGIDPGGWG